MTHIISGADSIRHGGHVPPLLQMAGQEGYRTVIIEEQKTRN